MTVEGSYSSVANEQLDALEAGPAIDLYDNVLDVCERDLTSPGEMQQRSAGIVTEEGIRFVTSVPWHPPDKVFWSRDTGGQARIEAVFPRP